MRAAATDGLRPLHFANKEPQFCALALFVSMGTSLAVPGQIVAHITCASRAVLSWVHCGDSDTDLALFRDSTKHRDPQFDPLIFRSMNVIDRVE